MGTPAGDAGARRTRSASARLCASEPPPRAACLCVPAPRASADAGAGPRGPAQPAGLHRLLEHSIPRSVRGARACAVRRRLAPRCGRPARARAPAYLHLVVGKAALRPSAFWSSKSGSPSRFGGAKPCDLEICFRSAHEPRAPSSEGVQALGERERECRGRGGRHRGEPWWGLRSSRPRRSPRGTTPSAPTLPTMSPPRCCPGRGANADSSAAAAGAGWAAILPPQRRPRGRCVCARRQRGERPARRG